MISYHDNVDGMRQAINAKKAKYKGEGGRLRDKHGIIDLTEMPKPNANADKGLRASVDNISNTKPAFFTISEDKGGPNDFSNMDRDEYEKYDSQFDGDADQFLINSGATIIDSRIEITDSSGRNRTIVRRKQG